MQEVELLPGKKALCLERNEAKNCHHAKMMNYFQGIKTWKHFQAESMGKKYSPKKQQTPKVLNPAKKFDLQIKPGKNL